MGGSLWLRKTVKRICEVPAKFTRIHEYTGLGLSWLKLLDSRSIEHFHDNPRLSAIQKKKKYIYLEAGVFPSFLKKLQSGHPSILKGCIKTRYLIQLLIQETPQLSEQRKEKKNKFFKMCLNDKCKEHLEVWLRLSVLQDNWKIAIIFYLSKESQRKGDAHLYLETSRSKLVWLWASFTIK